MNINSFESLGLSEIMLQSIKSKGFEEPTEIQSKIIPLILKNNSDLIGQAQTGTGKTAAFALPILDLLDEVTKGTKALVLVPTRELAIQVSDEFSSLKGGKPFHIAPIYGGQSYETQFRRLNKGVDVIVGTPGRIIDHLNRESISLKNVSYVVLDEADEMLNMGFIDDIEEILSKTNKNRRTLLFSATMPPRIMDLAKRYMNKHEIVKTKKSGRTADLTDQKYFEVKESDKFDALCRIIDTTVEFYGLIFCRTKTDVDFVSSKLIERGYDAEGLHGDISQTIREKILGKFRRKNVNILVATDVAARGLDIEDLTHVINYSLPQDPESYLHRIGRTGRAGKEGTAVTFVTPEEFRKLTFIKNITQTEIRKERVPQIREVIDFKKSRIISEVNNLVEYGAGANYIMLAQDLLRNNNPEDVVAALIKYNYQNELEENSYAKIHDLFDRKKKDSQDGKFEFESRKGRDKRGRDTREGRRDRDSKDGKRERDRDFSRDGRKDRDSREGRRERGSDRSFTEKGKIRMFLALGKYDDLDVKGLLKMLKKETGIPSEKITGVQISDAFSFFNVNDKKSRPIVERAKSK